MRLSCENKRERDCGEVPGDIRGKESGRHPAVARIVPMTAAGRNTLMDQSTFQASRSRETGANLSGGRKPGIATSAHETLMLPISRGSSCPRPEDDAYPMSPVLLLEDLFHVKKTVLHLRSHRAHDHGGQ